MRNSCVAAAMVVFALACGLARGQTPPEGAPATETAAPAPETTAPVPVPEPSEKAVRYHRSGNVLWVVDLLWGLLIPALFLFTGFSARIRTFSQRIGRVWFFTLVIYFIVFTVLNFVIGLPLAYYEGFVRQHAYDMSNQTFGKWIGDALKGLMVGLIGGALLLWIPYLLLKKSPTRWWLYTALLAIPILFLVFMIVPIWVDPLFNDFGPMQDKALEGKILALADRAGIAGSRVFEVNKSIDTKAVNAYVTGFFSTKRIVLWDTIIAKLDPDELLFVMGHEMGHYVLWHVVKSIIFLSAVLGFTLYAAHRLSGSVIARYGRQFGFDRFSDIAALPLLLVLSQLLGFAITPIVAAYSRHEEHEADRFGLEITRDNHAAATAFVKLQQENLAIPRPSLLEKLWRADHPPLGERIDFCNEYHPWREGAPLKYGKLFKGSD
ncbi:MAG TPA: M48 family metallopeptidase [Candidatus Polarisedimenticolaceae bacterium]|nr:M48 family metallopeptidase [Candidatus Polarisedimenticolaceae bacterium]